MVCSTENLIHKYCRGSETEAVHAMTARGWVEIELHSFLASALDGSVWWAKHTGRFIPAERFTGTHCAGSCVGDSQSRGQEKKSCLREFRFKNIWSPVEAFRSQVSLVATAWTPSRRPPTLLSGQCIESAVAVSGLMQRAWCSLNRRAARRGSSERHWREGK